MRDYAKVSPKIWIGDTGKALKKRGIETQLLAHYLISSPHGNMIGIYYLPFAFIAHETGMSAEAISRAMRNLIELDFCTYDEEKEFVWVHNMGRFQVSEKLKPRDNRVQNVNSYFKNLPYLNLLRKFYQKYKIIFHLAARDDVSTVSEGASETLQSQEQEAEQDEDQEGEEEKGCVAESQNDSALVKNYPDEFDCFCIPLKGNTEFVITESLIDQWKQAFPTVHVTQVLKQIQEWNTANPRKRKSESGILRHINLWLGREQDKSKKLNPNELNDYNQSIADEWLQEDRII